MSWARIDGGTVQEITNIDPTGRFVPELTWVSCPAGTAPGEIYIAGQNGATGVFTAPTDATAPEPRYVPLATIRDRVTADGKWAAFAAALDSLPADKRWHLLTLTQGVAPDDPDAIALLTACGCDPTEVLA